MSRARAKLTRQWQCAMAPDGRPKRRAPPRRRTLDRISRPEEVPNSLLTQMHNAHAARHLETRVAPTALSWHVGTWSTSSISHCHHAPPPREKRPASCFRERAYTLAVCPCMMVMMMMSLMPVVPGPTPSHHEYPARACSARRALHPSTTCVQASPPQPTHACGPRA